jgi:hypothetical protein
MKRLAVQTRCNGIRLAAGLLGALALAACSSGVSAAKMSQIKPAMKVDQVEAILGQPAHIEQSEIPGMLRGEVYHYPGSSGEGIVVFLNDAVFKANFLPGVKST